MMPTSLAAAHSKAEHHLRLALMALTLALSLVLGACSGAADSGTGSRNSGAPANPLFYEIARDDGTARGWLLGTIHALPDGTAWRTPAIDAAVAEADGLIVEVAGLDDGATSAQVFRELAVTPGLPRSPRGCRPNTAHKHHALPIRQACRPPSNNAPKAGRQR
ncbi:MAG: TraB/GumN family protein [Erythrobacter sp.]